jgi:hypothetical protein
LTPVAEDASKASAVLTAFAPASPCLLREGMGVNASPKLFRDAR